MRRPGSILCLSLTLSLATLAPAAAQTHPNFARGFEPGKAYQIGDVDSVSLFNGSLTLTIPLGPTYPVGGTISYGLTLTYSTGAWEFQEECQQGDVCTAQVRPARHFRAGLGWTVSFGETVEATIQRTFGPLDPTGRMAAECWRDYQRKLALWTASGPRFDALRERWDDVVAPRLRELARPSGTIWEILRHSGPPLSFEALDPPIPREQARFALANAHLIRERFVIGDLLWWLDLAGPELADELLASGPA